MDAGIQDVYVGQNLGLDYFDLDAARLRMFGGTSGHWNGQCRELDPGNFEARPHHPLGAWPIAKADLDPYQPAADAILDVSDPALPDIPVPGEAFRRVQYRFSPPTRFAEKYEAEFTAAPRIFLCLNASLVDLRLDETLETVTGAVFRSYAPGDPGFTVRARAYALCCGGIENARLLLNFDSQVPGGIGNRHDLVGRHFAEHPSFHLGEMIYRKPPDADFLFFTPSEAFMAENETLGIVLRLNHQPPPRTTLGREVTRSLQCAAPFGDRLAAAVNGRAMSCDRGGVSDFLALSGAERALWARVVTNCEQEMNPDSRVLLMAARDGFGMRRAALDWRLTEMDYRTMQRSTLALARHVAEHGLGRMRVYDGCSRKTRSRPPRATATAMPAPGTTWGPPAWPTTRAGAWSIATAGCTGPATSTSAARACSPRSATPTRPIRSPSSRCGSATTSAASCRADAGRPVRGEPRCALTPGPRTARPSSATSTSA